MSAPINISNYPILSKDGLNAVYMLEGSQMSPFFTSFFDVRNSDYEYEQVQEIIGSGLAKIKQPGQAMAFGTLAQGITSTFKNITYGLGLEVTMEEKRDNKYRQVVDKVKSLKRSIIQTKDTLAHNVLNRATTAGYTGGDGVVLLSAAHPTAAGNQSNLLSGSLTEKAIEDGITAIETSLDASGLRKNLRAIRLIVPSALNFEAQRICRSDLQSNTAENNMNVIKAKNYIPEIISTPYLDSNTQWFIQSNADNGLIYFENVPDTFEEDRAVSILADQYFSFFRGSFGWAEWRNIYGSTGV